MEKALRLKEVRKAVGLTQQQVAEKLGISQNNYSYWENGKVKIDNVSLQRLAELFDVTVDYLLGGSFEFAAIVEPTEKELQETRREAEKLANNVNTSEIDDYTKVIALISRMDDEEVKSLSKFLDILISLRKI